jgi:hypothetical protein
MDSIFPIKVGGEMEENKKNFVEKFRGLPTERKAMIAETAVVVISWLAKKAAQKYQQRKQSKKDESM